MCVVASLRCELNRSRFVCMFTHLFVYSFVYLFQCLCLFVSVCVYEGIETVCA